MSEIFLSLQAMTALETQSSKELLKSNSGDGKDGLRQRREKEQMVSDYSNVTNNLMLIR